jgi:uncharacterized membrane protein YfcA
MIGGERKPGDGIYLAILYVLVGSVIIGAVLALAGGSLYHDETMKNTGTGIVVVCGALYFVFRWLGRREIAKRKADARRGTGRGQNREQHDDGEEG